MGLEVWSGGAPELRFGSVTDCRRELGQEARAPIALGVLAALDHYDPAEVLEECREAEKLCDAVAHVLGAQSTQLRRTLLGPSLSADAVLDLALSRAAKASLRAHVVPCEASAALGMLLLRDHGILLVTAAGNPGARPSTRIKPTLGAVARAGGVGAVASALDQALTRLAGIIDSRSAMRSLLIGPEVD